MSEQAVLIPSVPPVARKSSTFSGTPSIPSDNATVTTEASILVPESTELAITPLQNLVHLSAIGVACLFAFAAIVAFQQSKNRAQAIKLLYSSFGIFLVILALHSFVSNRFFAAYLNQQIPEASLFYRYAGWIILAPLLAWMGALILGYDKARHGKSQLVDVGLWGLIFVFSAFALQSSIGGNGALLLVLLAVTLFIIVLARGISFKLQAIRCKVFSPLIQGMGLTLSWFGATLLPGALILLAFAKVLGLDHDLMHFFVTFTELMIVVIIFVGLIIADTGPPAAATADKTADATADYDPFATPVVDSFTQDASLADPFSMPEPANFDPDPFGEAPPPHLPKPTQKKPSVAKQGHKTNDPQLPAPPRKSSPSPAPGNPSIKAPPKPKHRF
jgi:hypothetical protein